MFENLLQTVFRLSTNLGEMMYSSGNGGQGTFLVYHEITEYAWLPIKLMKKWFTEIKYNANCV